MQTKILVLKTRQNRLTLVSNCSVCSKNQEASGLLSNLRIRVPLNNIPLIDDILFYGSCFEMISLKLMKSLTNFWW